MKKILFVINTLGLGGAEKALLELLNRLNKQGYDLSLLVLLNQGELVRDIPQGTKLLNKKFDYTAIHSPKGLKRVKLTAIKKLFSNFSGIRLAGYIISNYIDMKKRGISKAENLLWRAVAMGSPKLSDEYDLAVSFIEGGSAYYVSDYVKAKKKACFIHIDYESAGYGKKLDKDCFEKFDKVFPISEGVRQSFLNVYPEYKEKTFVFENLVDLEGIEAKSRLAEGFEDDFDGMRILSMGRLNAQKSYDMSVDAMKILIDKGYKVRWYILGEGDQRELLANKIAELNLKDDFILLGNKENPYPYLKQCDIYSHATKYEGKSIAVQEAKMLRCPIILTNTPGNLEQITDGYDGLLCEFNPQSLAEKLERYINNPSMAKEMGEKARESFLASLHDEENIAQFTSMLL
ncbi:MAG: glycosyltransferase [Lachnospiraceae bacterium]|nr:glycosyltransferase [Lachnospiraceae bacterium]